MRVILDSKGEPTKHFDLDFPLWSQEDDYIFKQFEEAEQDGKAIFMFTGRGFGKTYMVVSVAGKIYYLIPRSHSVISGSLDDHASETFSKLKSGMTGLEIVHPTLFYNRLTDNTELIKSGYYEYIDGKNRMQDSFRSLKKSFTVTSPVNQRDDV
jgi:hypothetical protein